MFFVFIKDFEFNLITFLLSFIVSIYTYNKLVSLQNIPMGSMCVWLLKPFRFYYGVSGWFWLNSAFSSGPVLLCSPCVCASHISYILTLYYLSMADVYRSLACMVKCFWEDKGETHHANKCHGKINSIRCGICMTVHLNAVYNRNH